MTLLLSVLFLAAIKLTIVPEALGKSGNPNNLVHPNMSDCFYVSTQSDNVPANDMIEGTNYTSFFLANLDDDTHLPLISPTITMDSEYAPSSFWSISPWPNSTENIGSVHRYVWSKDVLYEQTLGSAPNIGPALYYEPYPCQGYLNFDSRRQIFPLIISNQTSTAVARVFITTAENVDRLCVIMHTDETNEVSPLIVESEVAPQPTPVSTENFTSSNEVHWEFLNVLAGQELEVTIPMQVLNKKYPYQVMYEPHITIFSHQGVLAYPWKTVTRSNVTLVHPRWGNVTFSGEGEYTWTYPEKIPQEIKGVDYDVVSMSSEVPLIHEGDLMIDGTNTLAIENCTFVQTGNIFVLDQAKLIFKNANFTFNQIYNDQYGIFVRQFGLLEMHNVEAISPKGFPVYLQDSARAKVEILSTNARFECHGNSSTQISYSSIYAGLVVRDYAEVIISNSTHLAYAITLDFRPFPDRSLSIEGLEPGFIEFWNININNSISNVFNLTIENSQIDGWEIALLSSTHRAEVKYSKIRSLWLDFSDAEINLNDLKTGFFDSWNLGNIYLVNSSVTDQLAFILSGVNATFLNSTIHLNLYGGLNRISIQNSTLRTLILAQSIATISFSQTTLCDGLLLQDSNLYCSGNITFEGVNLGRFVSSQVTRNYSIIVQDENNSPVENVELALFDKDNKDMWSGVSDSLGVASFNLTFTDSNCTDTLKIEAVKGDMSAIQNVTFLSNTPLTVTMRGLLQGDINQDSTVDILDAILLASSINSQPGSPRWNPNADLNGDGIIDIYDAIILSNNYGKTA